MENGESLNCYLKAVDRYVQGVVYHNLVHSGRSQVRMMKVMKLLMSSAIMIIHCHKDQLKILLFVKN